MTTGEQRAETVGTGSSMVEAGPGGLTQGLLELDVRSCAEGTQLDLCFPGRAVPLSKLTPILEELGINIVSQQRIQGSTAPGQKRHQQPFKGRFVLTDDDGQPLSLATLDSMVAALQTALHVTLSSCSGQAVGHMGSSHASTRSLSFPPSDTQAVAPASAVQVSLSTSTTGLQTSGLLQLPLAHHSRHSSHNNPTIPSLSHTCHNQPSGCLAGSPTSGLLDSLVSKALSPRTDALAAAPAPSAHQRSGPGSRGHGSCKAQGARQQVWGGDCAALADLDELLRQEMGSEDEEEQRKAECSARMVVEAIMASPVHTIKQDASLQSAKELMDLHGISALLVDTGGRPGFLTKGDYLAKVPYKCDLTKMQVKQITSFPVISVPFGTSLSHTADVIKAHRVRRVLVHDAQRCTGSGLLDGYVGIVSDTDLFAVLGGSASDCDPCHMTCKVNSPPTGVPQASAMTHAPSKAISQASCASEALSHLAHSISSLSEQDQRDKGHPIRLSTKERYLAASLLWELDYSEIEEVRQIGHGSFGEVLLATFRGSKVAVKRLRTAYDGIDTETEPGKSPTVAPHIKQLFEREIEIMASVRSPNVVTFLGACHQPPNVCLVTEFCSRGSLDNVLHKSGVQLDLLKKVEFALDVARGMSCLHGCQPPIVHRDLKPANLLVSSRYEIKVADFGLSRIKEQAALKSSRAGLEGTVEYAAPEVLRGESYTEKCDLWSFGVVLHEILTRSRPYADAEVPIYLLMICLGNGTLQLADLCADQATPGLARLVKRCLQLDPTNRPTFMEVVKVLEHEHKELRGKAQSVPRSDSASSMAILAKQHQQQQNSQPSSKASASPERCSTGAQSPCEDIRCSLRLNGATGGECVQRGAEVCRPGHGARHMHTQSVGEQQGVGHAWSRFVPAPLWPTSTTAAHTAGPAGCTLMAAEQIQDHQGAAGRTHIRQDTALLSQPGCASGTVRQQQRSSGRGARPRTQRMARARSTPLPQHPRWLAGGEDSWDADTAPAAPGAQCGTVGNQQQCADTAEQQQQQVIALQMIPESPCSTSSQWGAGWAQPEGALSAGAESQATCVSAFLHPHNLIGAALQGIPEMTGHSEVGCASDGTGASVGGSACITAAARCSDDQCSEGTDGTQGQGSGVSTLAGGPTGAFTSPFAGLELAWSWEKESEPPAHVSPPEPQAVGLATVGPSAAAAATGSLGAGADAADVHQEGACKDGTGSSNSSRWVSPFAAAMVPWEEVEVQERVSHLQAAATDPPSQHTVLLAGPEARTSGDSSVQACVSSPFASASLQGVPFTEQQPAHTLFTGVGNGLQNQAVLVVQGQARSLGAVPVVAGASSGPDADTSLQTSLSVHAHSPAEHGPQHNQAKQLSGYSAVGPQAEELLQLLPHD